MTTLLEMVDNVAGECGYSVDTEVIGSTQDTTVALLKISNRIAKEAAAAYEWPELRKLHTFTLSTGVTQYAFPGDLNWQIHNTIWNRDEDWPLFGPLTTQELQYIQSSGITPSISHYFTVIGVSSTQLTIEPAPTSTENGQTVALYYISDRGVRPKTWEQGETISSVGTYRFYNGNYYRSTTTGTTGSTPPTHITTPAVIDGTGGVTWEYYTGSYREFLADTDEPTLDPLVIEQGILERFAERKGVPVEPRYESDLELAFERSKPGRTIYADTRNRGSRPYLSGIY